MSSRTGTLSLLVQPLAEVATTVYTPAQDAAGGFPGTTQGPDHCVVELLGETTAPNNTVGSSQVMIPLCANTDGGVISWATVLDAELVQPLAVLVTVTV